MLKMLCAATAAVFVTAAGASAGIIVGPVSNPANGHQYYLLDAAGWLASEAEAQTLGGHLATINDAAEDDWVYSTFSTYGNVNRQLWIGLNDAGAEGTFVWSSGDPVSFTHFAPSEPNNSEGGEDYVHFFIPNDFQGRQGTWNDLNEAGIGATPFPPQAPYGVVEVVPEPAGLVAGSALAFLVARRRHPRRA